MAAAPLEAGRLLGGGGFVAGGATANSGAGGLGAAPAVLAAAAVVVVVDLAVRVARALAMAVLRDLLGRVVCICITRAFLMLLRGSKQNARVQKKEQVE